MTAIGDVRDAVYDHFIRAAKLLEMDANSVFYDFDTDPPPAGRLILGGEVAERPDDIEGKLWVRLVMRHTGREALTLANTLFRNEATIFATAFIPLKGVEDGPVKTGDRVMEALETIFDSTRINGTITTYASIPRESAPDDPWLPVTVETPMSYDERG